MGDPLSIASGVAGIVTLGLTVCSGLDTYFSAIEDRKEDVKQGSQLLALLRSHVGLIESNASTLNSRYAGATEAIAKALDLCQSQLQELDEVIKKISSVDGCSDMARTLRKSKSTVSYPFNRKRLIQVQDQLLKTTGVLGICVQTLILNVGTGVSRDLQAFKNAVNDSTLVTNGFLSRLDSEVETIGSVMGKTTAELIGISEQIEEQKAITYTTHALVRDTSNMVTNIKSGMEEIESWHRVQLQAIESARRDKTPRYLENTNAERQLIDNSFKMTCTCKGSGATPTRKSLQRYTFWAGLTICRLIESREDHEPTCRCYTKFALRTSTKTTLTYTGLREILSWALDVSVRRDQFGGFSILYRPRTYNVVKTSQALEMIFSDKWIDRVNSVPDIIELQRKLEIIYATRGASPFDVDKFGQNAAHRCIWCFGHLTREATSSKHLEEILNGLKIVLLFLSRVGVDIYAAARRGKNSMLDFVVATGYPSLLPCVYDILEKCDPQFDSGFDPEVVPKNWYGDNSMIREELKRCRDTFHDRPDVAQALGYGELSVAISERDESKLGDLIESPRFGVLLSERNVFGHNALHLCLTWTAGLRLLLEQQRATRPLMSDRDSYGFTPLDYALSHSGDICLGDICLQSTSPICGCSDVACMLLDKDCRVALDFSCEFGLRFASQKARILLLQHLKNRRERLREIAIRHLSDSELQELGVTPDALPDTMAEEIWAKLCRRGVLEGRHDGLSPNIGYEYLSYWKEPSARKGIFYFLNNPQVAEMAFNLGFRSIDEANIDHITPIQNLEHKWARLYGPLETVLAYAAWLIEKGARIDYSTNSLAISAAHSLARMVAWWALEDYETGSKGVEVPAEIARVLSLVCDSNTQSHIPCPCSPCGFSSPLHYFFVTALRESGDHLSHHAGPSNSYRKPIRLALHLIVLLHGVIEDLNLVCTAKSIIHILTMGVLGIGHLEMCHASGLKSEEGILKVKEEEGWELTLEVHRNLIEKLEDLTKGFEQEFLDQGVSIEDFLWNHWVPAMRQYREEREPLDRRTRQELRDLGVVWEEDGYESSCDFSDSDSEENGEDEEHH
ncbi:hypothetical protein NM208_g3352 [Fusarium decemcellulare]|uniref:Uncharacterized protein n=1 Tax=Fusarium decemcellulare TaxID=57161 RepID=A0ACC1SPQ1_9HYPO|nr:hypothetical protein NM208_g3352 [Fusarium decemcellulare]